MAHRRVALVGSGQTYHKSIRRDVNGQELINEAVTRALEDTGLTMDEIDGVIIGNMDHFEGINYVDCWSIDGSGGYLKPIMKLCTGGTTGTTLAMGGYNMVASGMFDKLLVIGWEKNSESDTTGAIVTATDPILDRGVMAGALAGLAIEASEYAAAYGATPRDAARVSVRDRGHACNNPYAHLRKAVTIEEVLSSPPLSDPLRLLDMCPRTDGACAVIYASEDYAEKLCSQPAWVVAAANRHTYSRFSDINGQTDMKSLTMAAAELWKKTGIKEPLKEIDVVELYQPYSWGGMKWIEDLGFCKRGEAPKLIWDGVTDMGGECPFNPSGGVISCNPIGATGLIRCAEIGLQIQGKADKRQVPGVKLGLATGFGGCYWSDVILYSKKKPS
jgi:acetyl-CoA C-acetyltransferase